MNDCMNCVSCGRPACVRLDKLRGDIKELALMVAPSPLRPKELGMNRREALAVRILAELTRQDAEDREHQ